MGQNGDAATSKDVDSVKEMMVYRGYPGIENKIGQDIDEIDQTEIYA